MKNKILIVVLICFGASMQAQKKPIVTAERSSDKIASIDPIKTYERIGFKGYKLSADQLKKVGNACYYNNELQKAAKFYNDLYAIIQEHEAEFYFRYAQSLKSINDLDKANQMMVLFNQKKT